MSGRKAEAIAAGCSWRSRFGNFSRCFNKVTPPAKRWYLAAACRGGNPDDARASGEIRVVPCGESPSNCAALMRGYGHAAGLDSSDGAHILTTLGNKS